VYNGGWGHVPRLGFKFVHKMTIWCYLYVHEGILAAEERAAKLMICADEMSGQ